MNQVKSYGGMLPIGLKSAGPSLKQNQRPESGRGDFQYFYVRTGTITRINEETYEADIEWADMNGGMTQINIGTAFASPRGFIGGMPTKGTTVKCMFERNNVHNVDPTIISFSKSNFKNSLDHRFDSGNSSFGKLDGVKHIIKQRPTTLSVRIDSDVARHKMKKLYPGEVLMMSEQGSEAHFDENIKMHNSMGNEFFLRGEDQLACTASLTNIIITDAGKIITGLIVRNDVLDGLGNDDKEGKIPTIKPITLPSGKRWYVPTPNNSAKTIDEGSLPWVEHRIELREVGDAILDATEETCDHDFDTLYKSEKDEGTDPGFNTEFPLGSAKDPGSGDGKNNHQDIFVKKVIGTLVGNNPTKEKSYGQVLWKSLYKKFDSETEDDAEYNPAYNQEDKKISKDVKIKIAENQLASLFSLQFDKTDDFGEGKDSEKNKTQIDVTKEGVILGLISASSDKHHVIGTEGTSKEPKSKGRSVELHFDGSIKTTHGRNVSEEESYRQDTKGKITQNIGSTEIEREDKQTGLKQAGKNRSIRLKTKGGNDHQYGKTEDNETSLVLKTDGQIVEWIGKTTKPKKINDQECKSVNNYGRKDNSINRVTEGSIEEVIGKNEKSESYNGYLEGQAKIRIGHTTTPSANDNKDVKGPNNEGKSNNSLVLETTKAMEIKNGGGNSAGHSVHWESDKGWILKIKGAANDQNALKVEITGKTNIKYTGDVTETVIGDWKRTISGSLIETIGMNRTTTITANDTTTINAASTTTIGAADTYTVGGAQTISVGGARMKNVGGIDSTMVGGMHNTMVGGMGTQLAGAMWTRTASLLTMDIALGNMAIGSPWISLGHWL